VCDEHDGQAAVDIQFSQQGNHVGAGAGVEIAGGLVAHQDRGLVDQRPGNGHPLLLAAGELSRMVVEPVGEADFAERLGGSAASFAGGDTAGIDQGKLDILNRRGAWQQVEVLKDKAEMAVAEMGPLVGGCPGNVFAVELIRAAGRPVEAAALADEDIIFRGPDAAGGLLQRPPERRLPSPLQGVLPAIVGLAGVWYVQSLLPENLAIALPLQQLFSMLLPLAAVIAWQRVDLVETLRLMRPAGRGWLSLPGAALLGAGLFLLGAMAIRWLVGDTPSAAADALAGRLSSLLTDTPWWLVVLVLAVIPAVCEELVFRGWMLSAVQGEQPSAGRQVAAVVLQAALFAVVHLLPERLPTTFAMGLVLGWMAIRTGSLLPGILCHAVHNAVPVGVSLLAGTSLETLEISPAALAGAGLLVAVVGAALVTFSSPAAAQRDPEPT
jgi:membrane protease YdiL (CAAX protease family)